MKRVCSAVAVLLFVVVCTSALAQNFNAYHNFNGRHKVAANQRREFKGQLRLSF
jgi:hypothetical protein